MSENAGSSADYASKGLPYSAKAEETARGIRITVHVYNKSIDETAKDVAELLAKSRAEIEMKGFRLAPAEDKEGGRSQK
jgi:hypothetical protein